MKRDDDPDVLNALYRKVLQDHSGGFHRTLRDYQKLFPGHEELIERAVRELASIGDDGSGIRHGVEDQDLSLPSAPRPGDTLGSYRIAEELGRGGQAVVYLADDLRLHRKVALKVLRHSGPETETTLLRFQREAEAASRLSHPGICSIYESGVSGSAAFIAMEYVPGITLSQLLEAEESSRGPQSKTELLRRVAIVEDAARALHVAHEAGIVHRDVKPSNIAITGDDRPVLLDFGLARDQDPDALSLTQTGDLFGTPAYMSPEQISGNRGALDRQTDIYSLGVVLFECLTGTRPFQGATLEALYNAILTETTPSLRNANPGVSRDLQVVVETTLERTRARRYQTALEFAEDLRRIQRLEPIRARPASAALRLRRWSQRNPALATAIIGLIVVLSVALILVELNRKELREALIDAKAGRLSQREKRVERLIETGFQKILGADARPGLPLFAEALALDPLNKTALAGAFLGRMPDTVSAREVLADLPEELKEDPDVLWMRSVLLTVEGMTAEANALRSRVGDEPSDLQLFLEGHRLVKNFSPPVDPGKANQALLRFRRAIMKAPRPRFHYYHSLMMAASSARDLDTMRDAGEALIAHWPESPGTWDAIAQFYFPLDRQKAIEAFKKILTLEPAPAPYLGLAWDHASRREWKEAFELLDLAIDLDPTFAAAHFNQAMMLQQSGRLEESREALHRCLDLEFVPEALHLLLATYSTPEEKLEVATELALRFPEASGVFRQRGEILLTQRKPEEALTDLIRSVELAPRDRLTLSSYSRGLKRAGLPLPERISRLTQLTRRHPNSAPIHYQLALAREEEGSSAQAIESHSRAFELNPEDERPLERLRALYEADENLGIAKGIRHLTELHERFPETPGLRLHLARLSAAGGDVARGVVHLREALLEAPKNTLFSELRTLLLRYSSAAEARRVFAELALDHPRNGAYHLEKGLLDLALGQWSEAVSSLTRSLELDPLSTDPIAPTVLAQVHSGDLDGAVDRASRAVSRWPNRGALQGVLGYALSFKGEFSRAAECHLKALQLDPSLSLSTPSDVEIPRAHLGILEENPNLPSPLIEEIREILGAPRPSSDSEDRSETTLRERLRIDPHDRSTRILLAERLRNSGRAREAWKLLQRGEEKADRDPRVLESCARFLLHEGPERDPVLAYAYARRAFDLSPTPSPRVLATLFLTARANRREKEATPFRQRALIALERTPISRKRRQALVSDLKREGSR